MQPQKGRQEDIRIGSPLRQEEIKIDVMGSWLKIKTYRGLLWTQLCPHHHIF